jgi:hypothetical protein
VRFLAGVWLQVRTLPVAIEEEWSLEKILTKFDRWAVGVPIPPCLPRETCFGDVDALKPRAPMAVCTCAWSRRAAW